MTYRTGGAGILFLLGGCVGSIVDPSNPDGPARDGSVGSADADPGPDRSHTADGSSTGDDVPTGQAACPAGDLALSLGADHLLVGGRMEDAEFDQAPFDLRYHYLADEIPADGPCESCASDCPASGDWWGCWQSDDDPPGRYVVGNIEEAEAAGAIPMISYYIWYYVAGRVEGDEEIAALADGAKVDRYLRDWRFALERVAEATAGPVILHVEPDLWGYGHQVDADPAAIYAAVSASAASECQGLPDTLAGFARCMLAMARALAPAALVGLHASNYGAGEDALHEDDPDFDIDGHADETAAFMTALGAADADLLIVEMSNADAGMDGRWWDASNATIPNFTRANRWAGRVASQMELPYLWWQVPYGHMGLSDQCDRYRDNRADYFFDHAHEFAAAGALGIAFGDALSCATTAATDDGHFLGRADAHLAADRPCFCDVCD